MAASYRVSWTLILLAVTLPVKAHQRSELPPDDAGQTLRVNVDLVTIAVRVSDRKGREVTGLKQEEFSIFEDRKRQGIAVFASEQQPVSIVLLLDRSYSMGQGGKLDQAKSALKQLIENGHPDNEYALAVFDDEAIPLLDFPSPRLKLERTLEAVNSHRSGSSLYDSIALALDRFGRAQYPRHVLVVITDGADQHSRLQLDDVLSAVQASRSQVYLVGFFDPKEDLIFRDSGKTVTLVSGREIDNPRYVFKRLAEESGAERFFPASGEELASVVRTISQDLQTQYTLGYYTSPATHGKQYRAIDVKVRPKGLTVRARHGFLSRGDDETSPVSAIPAKPTREEILPHRPLPYEIKVERRERQVIFREDFSDVASGWPQKEGFFSKAGRYHLEQMRPKTSNEGLVAGNGPWWTDFEASVVVEFPAARQDLHSMTSAAGLVFRLNERGYYALVISQPSGKTKVYYKLVKKFHAAPAHDLLFWDQELEWRPESGKPLHHKVGVVCRGSSIQLNVDGLRVRELRDEDFSDGLVGVVLFGEGHAVFDDLLAQSLVE